VTREATGGARVALAMSWCAVIKTHTVFGTPRFAWRELASPVDARVAAEYLASLAAPLEVTAHSDDDELVRLEIVPRASSSTARRDEERSWYARLLPDDESVALLLAGGRGLRVSRRMLVRFERDYVLRSPAAIAGGPPDDAWTDSLALPPSWLSGVSYVFLLGRASPGGSSLPMRMGDGLDPTAIEDL
jgi:hypothetical protein